MDKPGVYVICVHPLLCDALRSLLQQAGIQIVGRSSDPGHGLTEIQHLQPQVVLLEGTAISSDLVEALRTYVGQASGRRLLLLDPGQNVLSIYTHRDQIVQSSDDLVKALGMLEEGTSVYP
jgi:DNA-binding NarL/FixJ family response regulator